MASHRDQKPWAFVGACAKRSRSSIRVLVVDDFLPITSALVNILETNFYNARQASSAEEAFDIAEDFLPHVLISDVILSGMNGFRLAAEFERLYPDCRVLLMSAGYDREPNGRSPRVVLKASITEEAFQLLERCRESAETSRPPPAAV